MSDYITICGRTLVKRCKCKSKRSGQRCRNPAMKNGCCALHGGKSSGPSPEGRARIAKANTIHGRETRQKRADRRAKMAELYALEMLGRKIGLITGPKTSGRKPGE